MTPRDTATAGGDDVSLDLDAIKARAEAATVSPWRKGTAPHPDSGETKAEYQQRALVNGDEPLWVVWAIDGSTDVDYVVPAIAGDGPTSAANAEFIAYAREDVPALIAEVERLRAERDRTVEYCRDIETFWLDIGPETFNAGARSVAVAVMKGLGVEAGESR